MTIFTPESHQKAATYLWRRENGSAVPLAQIPRLHLRNLEAYLIRMIALQRHAQPENQDKLAHFIEAYEMVLVEKHRRTIGLVRSRESIKRGEETLIA